MNRRKRARDAGYTLVDLTVATLMVAMLAGPVMSVALTGKTNAGRLDRKLAAAAAVRRVAENLKPFVTADRAAAAGPGTGVGGWDFPGDASGLWALEAGTHTLSAGQWLSSLQDVDGRIAYIVTDKQTPSGAMPIVTFSVTWREP